MAAKKPATKSQIISEISERTELTKKDVTAVFAELSDLISRDLGNRGPKQFTVPGLMKIVVQNKPATKARKGINPFTGEETTFKAKPARNVVKVRPLKALKDMV
ncbi:MAG: HU family DNA-binding protein [Gammaproteobacteria bacterium]|nr:HU family DNA-binding protein [Gammaproteobacteria bacterium]